MWAGFIIGILLGLLIMHFLADEDDPKGIWQRVGVAGALGFAGAMAQAKMQGTAHAPPPPIEELSPQRGSRTDEALHWFWAGDQRIACLDGQLYFSSSPAAHLPPVPSGPEEAAMATFAGMWFPVSDIAADGVAIGDQSFYTFPERPRAASLPEVQAGAAAGLKEVGQISKADAASDGEYLVDDMKKDIVDRLHRSVDEEDDEVKKAVALALGTGLRQGNRDPRAWAISAALSTAIDRGEEPYFWTTQVGQRLIGNVPALPVPTPLDSPPAKITTYDEMKAALCG